MERRHAEVRTRLEAELAAAHEAAEPLRDAVCLVDEAGDQDDRGEVVAEREPAVLGEGGQGRL